MALPSKKSKLNINLDPPKAGNEYLKYGLDRIESLMLHTDKKTNYLPRSIEFSDIDAELKRFVDDGVIKAVIDGEEVKSFYLENERWGEFSRTWKFMDGDKNVPTPYTTIRRTDKSEGTRLGRKFAVPQGKAHKYLDVPIVDDGQVVYLRFKIPEPTNVDLIYDLRFFSKYRNDVNYFDKKIMNAFKSRQEYLWVKGNPMPVILDGYDSIDTVKNIDGDKYYVAVYRLRVQGFIQNEEEFKITRTSRQPNFGIDLDSSSGGGRPRSSIVGDDIVTVEEQITFTYSYPVLSQNVSYRERDEGWQINNVWNSIWNNPARVEQPAVTLIDFYTLGVPNRFGNYNRFTNTTGGTSPAPAGNGLGIDEIVVDNYLGLEFIGVSFDNCSWNDAMDFGATYDDGSWYLVPRTIQEQLREYDVNAYNNHLNDELDLFGNFNWTSTTDSESPTTAAYYTRASLQYIGAGSKEIAGSVDLGMLYRPITATTYETSINTIIVRNSDLSYSAETATNLLLPDITITDYTGGTTLYPSVKDVNLFDFTPPFLASGVTYAYPQLSQETSYRTGDEGWQIANVWQPIYNAQKTNEYVTNELSDFYTLKLPNIHGNYSRFTYSGGTAATGLTSGQYLQDHYLGIEILQFSGVFETWENWIDTVRTYDDGSWYPIPALITTLLTNINDSGSTLNDIITNGSERWTSTTVETLNTSAYITRRNVNKFDYSTYPKTSTRLPGLGYRLLPNAALTGGTLITISNSDDSFVQTGTTAVYELPDIQITDYNGTSSSYPSVKDIDLSAVTTPSYAYPQLTQETSYRTGDEGWQLTNLWNDIYTGNSNTRRSIVGLADFYTLETVNQFGNTSRFTRGDGTPVTFLTNDVTVYDNYLGIQFVQPPTTGFQTWDQYIDAARAYGDGSWYAIPLCIWQEWNDAERGSDFNNVINKTGTWTSTTSKDVTTNAYDIDADPIFNVGTRAKTPAFWRASLYYKPITSTTFASISNFNNVTNTDGSFSTNISDDLILPDIQITDYSGGTQSYPSAKDIVLSATTPIEYSYVYPILSQQNEFRTGDEAWQLTNWFTPIYNDTTPKFYQRLVDFNTLQIPNQFGNTLRFTRNDGTSGSGSSWLNFDEDYYDNYTGLIYRRVSVAPSALTWNDTIDFANAYDDGSWRLTPAKVLMSIMDYESQGDFYNNHGFERPSFDVWTSSTLNAVSGANALRYRAGGSASDGTAPVTKTAAYDGFVVYKLIPT